MRSFLHAGSYLLKSGRLEKYVECNYQAAAYEVTFKARNYGSSIIMTEPYLN